MSGYKVLQEQLDSLAHGDVLPVLLITDVGYGEDMWVDISLVDPSTVSSEGYSSIGPLFTKRFPHPPADRDVLAEEQRMRTATLEAFGARLRDVLAEP